MTDGSATAHLYKPKLLTVLGEGYDAASLRKDAIAGLTVAVVALPLSMAIAVASGVSPDRGVYTAIIGGFLVSALGGSRFQIGGPAGAFIVLVSATVTRFGLEELLATVFLSGLILTLVGFSRLGSLVRFIPHAVTVGFTCGIAVTILASQLKDLGGFQLSGPEPGPLFPKLAMLASEVATLDPWAVSLGVGSTLLIFLLRRYRPSWPGMLVAVVLASVLAASFHLPVETIHSHFGDIARGLPAFAVPDLTSGSPLQLARVVFSFTLLGGVESLLSAKVADGMTGRKHRYNMELVAQGIANIVSACFGGISVTGTIARTATNIRAGAQSPLAGIMHAAFLLVFVLVAAPLAGYIPLAALAGVLMVVSWNMAEAHEFSRLLWQWQSASVLLATFLLTLAYDLSIGILAGCAMAASLSGLSAKFPDRFSAPRE
jgi:SulP family sulfate permease